MIEEQIKRDMTEEIKDYELKKKKSGDLKGARIGTSRHRRQGRY